MGFKYRDILGEIIFSYVSGRPDISYVVVELYKFAENTAKCHYVEINRMVRYQRKYPENGTIWRKEEPKTTLLVGTRIPKVEMETQVTGAVNPCEYFTSIYDSYDT